MTNAYEHQHQVALMKWAQLKEREMPELKLLFAIPNGGDRHPAVGNRLKAEGVKRGVPDLCLPVSRGIWHGLFIEMKSATGTLSKSQQFWRDALKREVYRWELCRSWEQTADVLIGYLETK